MEADFEINYTRCVLTVIKEMSWTIDYVMHLGITQFNETKNFIQFMHEEERKAMNDKGSGSKPITFR